MRIGSSEAVVIGIVLLVVVAQLAMLVGLVVWGRWVARRRGGGIWSFLAWTPLWGQGISCLGMGLTSVHLIGAFEAVSAVSAENRATQLADDISASMNFTALFGVVGMVIWIGSPLIFLVGTLLGPRLSPSGAGQ